MKDLMEHRKRVRLILIEMDLTIAALARKIRHSRTWTSQVLYGHEKSAAVRKAIAHALGMKVAELWPEKNRKKEAA